MPGRSETKRNGTVLLTVLEPSVRELALAALGACGYTVLDAGPQPLLALRFAQEHAAPIDLAGRRGAPADERNVAGGAVDAGKARRQGLTRSNWLGAEAYGS